MRRLNYLLAPLLLASTAGCEPPTEKIEKTKSVAATNESVQAPQFVPRADPARAAANPTSSAPRGDAGPAPGFVREKASAALTAKGKYDLDLITTPVSTYFTVRDQVVFQYTIPKALQYYELAHGRKPRTYDEFTREIVEKNNLKLPELPPTHRYLYDPEKGELLVEHPQQP